MKITQRLVGDHITFRKMLDVLNAIADAPAAQRDHSKLIRTAELFKDHLTLHAWCEDTFYYPAVAAAVEKNSFGPLTRPYMIHLDDEHRTVDGYLAQLELEVKAKPAVPSWPQTYALFSKGLLAHMKKEEEELFPLSEKLLGTEKLESLSADLEKRRKDAPRARFHTLALLGIMILGGTTLSIADPKLTPREIEAKFPSDLGPDKIDVSSYPPYQQQNYELFQHACSICHTLARPINSRIVTHADWQRYVKRMHLRAKEQLLSKEEGRRIVDFLAFDAQQRKVVRKAEFDGLEMQLHQRFQEVRREQDRLNREKKSKTKEPTPYTGTP